MHLKVHNINLFTFGESTLLATGEKQRQKCFVFLHQPLDIWLQNFTCKQERQKKKGDALIKWEMLSVSSSDSSYLVKELCQQVRKTREKCSNKKRNLLLVFLYQPSLIFGATISQEREGQGEDKERNALTRRELCF